MTAQDEQMKLTDVLATAMYERDEILNCDEFEKTAFQYYEGRANCLQLCRARVDVGHDTIIAAS